MPEKINKILQLDKPLIIFDLETTGLSLSMDKIIEIAYVKIFPDGRMKEDDIFLNPEMKISDESVAVHGIRNEDLEGKKIFRDVAQELWDVFSDCYYGGYNIINFDLPILRREFLRVGYDFDYHNSRLLDSKLIYNYMEPRTLSAAYKYYCDKEHYDAHSALSDVKVTAEIFSRQLDKYEEIRDWEFLNKIHKSSNERFVDNDRKFYWRDGQAHFSFSKYRDMSLAKVAQIDPSFLRWISEADFSEETKNIVKKALAGIFPVKPPVEAVKAE